MANRVRNNRIMLAVTTRNKLKSIRFYPHMLLARGNIRAQLKQTPGLLRWADAVASPTEFFTFTVWENKQTMFNFMSGDAHRDMVWMFARWSDEFWSMRWGPTENECGAWDGMSLKCAGTNDFRVAPPPIPSLARTPRTGGFVSPEACAVTALVALSKKSCPRLDFKKRAANGASPKLLRWAVGDGANELRLHITLWREYEPRLAKELAAELPNAWVMEWKPGDYEIGHWNGMRLRQFTRGAYRNEVFREQVEQQA